MASYARSNRARDHRAGRSRPRIAHQARHAPSLRPRTWSQGWSLTGNRRRLGTAMLSTGRGEAACSRVECRSSELGSQRTDRPERPVVRTSETSIVSSSPANASHVPSCENASDLTMPTPSCSVVSSLPSAQFQSLIAAVLAGGRQRAAVRGESQRIHAQVHAGEPGHGPRPSQSRSTVMSVGYRRPRPRQHVGRRGEKAADTGLDLGPQSEAGGSKRLRSCPRA